MRSVIFVFALLVSWVPRLAAYPVYEGSLSSGGLNATSSWNTKTSFSWDVSYDEISDAWIYNYHLSVNKKTIQYVYLETSSTFSEENILEGTSDFIKLGMFGEEENQPDTLFGIEFAPQKKKTEYTFTIVTDRAPAWGDFYAIGQKTGKAWNTVSNSGFKSPDTDPLALLYPADDGSVFGHILIPGDEDTDSIIGGEEAIIVPEPATFLLLIAAICIAAGRIKHN
ncbi:hypothetical protein KDK77_05825 [bacterium]|nr:hypothetical protein [bacterium]